MPPDPLDLVRGRIADALCEMKKLVDHCLGHDATLATVDHIVLGEQIRRYRCAAPIG